MKMTNFDVSSLVDDLSPVRVVRRRDNLLLTTGATLLASLAIVMTYGIRGDLLVGDPHPIVMIRAGLLLLLGLAASLAISAAARPSVGKPQNGWMWALAAAAVLPIAALGKFLFLLGSGQPLAMFTADFEYGLRCLGLSLGSAMWIGGLISWWLKRGAPISLNRAGWLVGIAAGSLGTFSFNIYCNSISLYYIGLWYSLAVLISAVVGRLIVPHIIRW
jgi:hypothetical protein